MSLALSQEDAPVFDPDKSEFSVPFQCSCCVQYLPFCWWEAIVNVYYFSWWIHHFNIIGVEIPLDLPLGYDIFFDNPSREFHNYTSIFPLLFRAHPMASVNHLFCDVDSKTLSDYFNNIKHIFILFFRERRWSPGSLLASIAQFLPILLRVILLLFSS